MFTKLKDGTIINSDYIMYSDVCSDNPSMFCIILSNGEKIFVHKEDHDKIIHNIEWSLAYNI